MPEITVSITDEEAELLGIYYTSSQVAIEDIVGRRIQSIAKTTIMESSSTLDPNKLDRAGINTELKKISDSGEIEKMTNKDKIK